MNSNNIILSLDQGTKISGYAVFCNSKLIKSGILKTPTTEKPPKRMFSMISLIEELIIEYKPNEIIIEEPFAKVNLRVFQVLCEFFGMLLYMCNKINIPVSSYTAAVWRAEIELKGKNRVEQKKKSMDLVKELFDLECTDDEAEAILMGYSHIKKTKKGE